MVEISITRVANRGLQRMPAGNRAKLVDKIKALAAHPDRHHSWARDLVGRPGVRIRQSDWRAIVELDQEAGTLTVLRVGHRREVYG